MTNGAENKRLADELAEVSTIYRATRQETTPAHLDRAILRAAAEEAGKPRPGEWLSGWSRPLAFAATLVLCIAMLLELSDQQLLGISGNTSVSQPETANLIASPDAEVRDERNAVKRAPSRPAVVESAPALTSADEDAGSLSPGQDEATTTKSSAIGEPSPSLRDAADIAARQVQAVEASADAALKEMPEDDVSTAPGKPASALPRDDSAAPAETRCSAGQRETPGDWWQCINELTKAGFTTEANSELRNLRDAFPRFDTGQ